jgi:hypothetical protein
MSDLVIQIVDDEACPHCGAGWPNRPKVADDKGWWWRCYTEGCDVGYYLPETGEVELRS